MYEDEGPPLCPLSEHFCGFPAFHACRLASPGIPVGESLQLCLRLIQTSVAGAATSIIFVATHTCLLRQNVSFVVTKVGLPRQMFCRDNFYYYFYVFGSYRTLLIN